MAHQSAISLSRNFLNLADYFLFCLLTKKSHMVVFSKSLQANPPSQTPLHHDHGRIPSRVCFFNHLCWYQVPASSAIQQDEGLPACRLSCQRSDRLHCRTGLPSRNNRLESSQRRWRRICYVGYRNQLDWRSRSGK